MQSTNSKCIVIGTKSKNFSEMISKYVREYCRYNVIPAFTDLDLKSTVNIYRPYLVLIDSCAWQKATPYMIEFFQKRYPKTFIAVFSFESMTLKEAVMMIERGARGMVNVRFDDYAFSRGIKTVIEGRDYIPPEVEKARDEYGVVYDGKVNLTAREEQVYQLLAEGKSDPGIAEKLNISDSTANNHRSSVYRKCGVKGIHEFMRFAQTRGDCIIRDSFAVKQTDDRRRQ
jgi:two-component system response regulator DegU